MVFNLKLSERSWSAKASGTSMLPLIKSGAELELELLPASHIQVGDIIVFSRPPETLVAHRVIGIKNKGKLLFITKGDHRWSADSPVSQNDILGRVVKINGVSVRSWLKIVMGRGVAFLSYGQFYLWRKLKDSALNHFRRRGANIFLRLKNQIIFKMTLCLMAFKQECFAVKIACVYYIRKRHAKSPFFILCDRRTGSHLFVSYLNSTQKVFFADEIFSQLQPYGLRRWGVSKKMALRHVRHYLNWCKTTVCGVKIFFSDFKELGLEMDDFLREFPHARWFVLYRENMLDQYLSYKLAQKTNEWLRLREPPLPSRAQIVIDPQDIAAYCTRERSWYASAQNNKILCERALWLSYEELVDDPQKLFDTKVFPFLGVPASTIRTNHLKQNKRSYFEVIANYSKQISWIEQTNFMHKYHLRATGSSESAKAMGL